MKKIINPAQDIGNDIQMSFDTRIIQKKNKEIVSLEKRELNIDSLLESFFNLSSHPCLGAHSVMNTKNYKYNIYSELGSETDAIALCKNIYSYLEELPRNGSAQLYSYFALFKNTDFSSEVEFEEKLWEHLNHVHAYDVKNFKWDSSVSSNVDDANFSFSIGERGFYIVGMHPHSSRKARRFPYTLLVFNLHEQFETLRKKGKYDKLKNMIRGRDEKINGDINPMMNDFGAISEARQYSGRRVNENWKCPFHVKS